MNKEWKQNQSHSAAGEIYSLWALLYNIWKYDQVQIIWIMSILQSEHQLWGR